MLGFVDFDQARYERALAERIVFRAVEREQGLAQEIPIGIGHSPTGGKHMGGHGPLLGHFLKPGPLFGGEMFVLVQDVIANGGGLGLAPQHPFHGRDITAAEPDVIPAKEILRGSAGGHQAAPMQIVQWDYVSGGASTAGERDGQPAQIGHRSVGFISQGHPVAAIPRATFDLPCQQEGRRAASSRVQHVRGAHVGDVDGAVGQSLDNHRAGERYDHLHRPLQFGGEDGRQPLPLRQHGVRIFVRLQGHHERGGRALGRPWCGAERQTKCQDAQPKPAANRNSTHYRIHPFYPVRRLAGLCFYFAPEITVGSRARPLTLYRNRTPSLAVGCQRLSVRCASRRIVHWETRS